MSLTPSPVLGEVVINQLIQSGARDAVITPGSRNAPLTMALWRAAASGHIRLHTRIDERSAAFLALGIARASGLPTPVICTSGSAAANFYPALVEAHHSAVPLIAVTADRPSRLWNTGANQTMSQVGMYPAAGLRTVNLAVEGERIGQVALWRNAIAAELNRGTPAHFNVEFEEPLVGSLQWVERLDLKATESTVHPPQPRNLERYESHGVILVGHDAAGISYSDIRDFAEKTGWPILSENPLLGDAVIAHPALILADQKRREDLRPKIAVVVGRLTLSRALAAYQTSAEYVVVVDPRTAEVDTERDADEIHLALPTIASNTQVMIDPRWRKNFEHYAEKIAEKLPGLISEWSEPSAVKGVIEEIPDGSALFVASSMPIRDIEAFVEPRSGIDTFANRGLAGIDGNISTAYGIALSRPRSYAILGDLAFLHDINGLLVGVDEIRPNLTIVVIANDGGGIFSTLPQRDVPGFEKIFGTPHGRDIAAIAESYGIPAVNVRTLDALRSQLARSGTGIRVIVAQMPDRSENAALHRRVIDSLALL